MARRIVLLSGRIRAGKTTLARALVERYGARLVKTRELIAEAIPDIADSRKDLQAAGDRLDGAHDGKWISNALLRKLVDSDELVVVDSVRIESQIRHIRSDFKRSVIHVHLTVSDAEADRRLKTAVREIKTDVSSYAEAKANPTEAAVESLAPIADIHVDTERDQPEDVVVRVAGRLGLLRPRVGSYVDAIVGGQYGSEGKGHICWFLAPEYDYLIRVGGPNAGHTVLKTGGKYVFHTLPSGTAEAGNARLIIGPGAVISLDSLFEEIRDEQVSAERLSIDPQAMIIEPEDAEFEAGSIRNTIASTAQGGGYAGARRMMRGSLEPDRPIRLARDVEDLRPFVRSTAELLEIAFAKGARVMLEGTQGSGLSLYHGHYPHVTSRDTNISGVLAEAGIAPRMLRRLVMVTRTYPIRVQDPDTPGKTSGPMARKLSWEDVAGRSRLNLEQIKATELTSTTNRERRVSEFDWALFSRAVHLNRPTDIALTHADYLDAANVEARRFDQLTLPTQSFVAELEGIADAPVSLISTRFDERSIVDRRSW